MRMRTIITTAISTKIMPLSVALGLGVMAGVGITDAWSAHQRHSCKGQERTHSVVSLPTFWGHSSLCVDRRML